MLVNAFGAKGNFEHWKEVSDEEFERIKREYYQKPHFSEVVKEMRNGSKGNSKNSAINRYYFFDLMTKVQVRKAKWTIEQVFQDKNVFSIFYGRIHNQPMFQGQDVTTAIACSIRVGGAGVATKPAQFPVKTVDYILSKYNINNVYYDFSCGWGDRLFSAMKNNVNYIGTDPNYLLCERLEQFADDYDKHAKQRSLFNTYDETSVSIRCTGSEILQSDLVGKVGLAFSSPPYFLLEDYKIGDQSCHRDTSYDDWKEKYLRPTIRNIRAYLIKGGYFIINIKNYDKIPLEEDTEKIADEEGFYLERMEDLNPKTRPSHDEQETLEKIRVFRRKYDR